LDLFDAVKNRRSVRSFKGKELEEEKLSKILTAASWAPSAGNLKAREFIVVRERELKKKLAEAAHQGFIEEASCVVVVCINYNKIRPYGSRGEKLYCIMDAAAAIQNMLLAAHGLGVGSCWVGAFDENQVSEILGVPEYAVPVAFIPLGYSAQSPSPPPRGESVHEEGW